MLFESHSQSVWRWKPFHTYSNKNTQLPVFSGVVQMWFSFTVTNGGFTGNIYTSEGHKTYRLFFQLQRVPIPSWLKAAVCHFYVASFNKIEAALQKWCMFEILVWKHSHICWFPWKDSRIFPLVFGLLQKISFIGLVYQDNAITRSRKWKLEYSNTTVAQLPHQHQASDNILLCI